MSEVHFRRTSDLVDLTRSTAVSVEGASQGISNVEQKVDKMIGALPQIQQGVAQLASHVQIVRSSSPGMERSMERRIQVIESLTSQILPDFQKKLDQLPLRIQEGLAGSTALAGVRPSAETSGLNLRKSASENFTDMVLSFDRYNMQRR